MTLEQAYAVAARMAKDEDLNLRTDELEALDALVSASKIAERVISRLDELEARL